MSTGSVELCTVSGRHALVSLPFSFRALLKAASAGLGLHENSVQVGWKGAPTRLADLVPEDPQSDVITSFDTFTQRKVKKDDATRRILVFGVPSRISWEKTKQLPPPSPKRTVAPVPSARAPPTAAAVQADRREQRKKDEGPGISLNAMSLFDSPSLVLDRQLAAAQRRAKRIMPTAHPRHHRAITLAAFCVGGDKERLRRFLTSLSVEAPELYTWVQYHPKRFLKSLNEVPLLEGWLLPKIQEMSPEVLAEMLGRGHALPEWSEYLAIPDAQAQGGRPSAADWARDLAVRAGEEEKEEDGAVKHAKSEYSQALHHLGKPPPSAQPRAPRHMVNLGERREIEELVRKELVKRAAEPLPAEMRRPYSLAGIAWEPPGQEVRMPSVPPKTSSGDGHSPPRRLPTLVVPPLPLMGPHQPQPPAQAAAPGSVAPRSTIVPAHPAAHEALSPMPRVQRPTSLLGPSRLSSRPGKAARRVPVVLPPLGSRTRPTGPNGEPAPSYTPRPLMPRAGCLELRVLETTGGVALSEKSVYNEVKKALRERSIPKHRQFHLKIKNDTEGLLSDFRSKMEAYDPLTVVPFAEKLLLHFFPPVIEYYLHFIEGDAARDIFGPRLTDSLPFIVLRMVLAKRLVSETVSTVLELRPSLVSRAWAARTTQSIGPEPFWFPDKLPLLNPALRWLIPDGPEQLALSLIRTLGRRDTDTFLWLDEHAVRFDAPLEHAGKPSLSSILAISLYRRGWETDDGIPVAVRRLVPWGKYPATPFPVNGELGPEWSFRCMYDYLVSPVLDWLPLPGDASKTLYVCDTRLRYQGISFRGGRSPEEAHSAWYGNHSFCNCLSPDNKCNWEQWCIVLATAPWNIVLAHEVPPHTCLENQEDDRIPLVVLSHPEEPRHTVRGQPAGPSGPPFLLGEWQHAFDAIAAGPGAAAVQGQHVAILHEMVTSHSSLPSRFPGGAAGGARGIHEAGYKYAGKSYPGTPLQVSADLYVTDASGVEDDLAGTCTASHHRAILRFVGEPHHGENTAFLREFYRQLAQHRGIGLAQAYREALLSLDWRGAPCPGFTWVKLLNYGGPLPSRAHPPVLEPVVELPNRILRPDQQPRYDDYYDTCGRFQRYIRYHHIQDVYARMMSGMLDGMRASPGKAVLPALLDFVAGNTAELREVSAAQREPVQAADMGTNGTAAGHTPHPPAAEVSSGTAAATALKSGSRGRSAQHQKLDDREEEEESNP